MNDKFIYHFGIKTSRLPMDAWGFGSCLAHCCGETYVYINFLFWSLSIGWIIREE